MVKVLRLGDEYYTLQGPFPVGDDGLPADAQVITLQELSMKDLKDTGFVLDEEEENQKKQMKKQDKQQRGSKSAYAIFMSEQRSAIAFNMEVEGGGITPKTTDVMKEVARYWAELKTKAKAGDPDASVELERLKSLAAEEKAAWNAKVAKVAKVKSPVKKPNKTIKKGPEKIKKRHKLMISMSELEVYSETDGVPMEDDKYRKQKKAEKKRVMKGGVESVDSSDSDSEQPVKNAD